MSKDSNLMCHFYETHSRSPYNKRAKIIRITITTPHPLATSPSLSVSANKPITPRFPAANKRIITIIIRNVINAAIKLSPIIKLYLMKCKIKIFQIIEQYLKENFKIIHAEYAANSGLPNLPAIQ